MLFTVSDDRRLSEIFQVMRNRVRRFNRVSSLLVALAIPFCSGVAPAASYPERPIELIVPWGPGGGADQLARLVGKLMEPLIGQSIPVVNVPGGTGAAGMAKLLSAPADGYSMAIYIADSHALLVGKDARWKIGDITPAAVLVQAPSFLFVAQDSRFKSWGDFERESRTGTQRLKVATLGFGSVDEFSLKAIEVAGAKLTQVPFSKPSERYVSILGGHADALYEQAGDVSSFLQGKQMRPLLMFGEKRSSAFKDVPTSYELGYKVALPQFRAIVLRSETSPERLKVLSDALAKVADMPEYKKFLEDQFAATDSFIDASRASRFMQRQLDEMKQAAGMN
jgi:tripartite-type tricarboxylate transporter receptor subunit TctC